VNYDKLWETYDEKYRGPFMDIKLLFKPVWPNLFEKLSETKTFNRQGTYACHKVVTSHKGYRCKSGIAIFAWRVTWNDAESHFND